MGQTHNRYGAFPVDVSKADQGIKWIPVADSVTATKGDFAILTSGQADIALAASAELCGVFAADVATPTQGDLVPVYADPDTVFEVIADADSSSIVAGNARDIIGATGKMMMDADATSTNVLLVLRANPDDTTTTANARWQVKIRLHAFADVSS